MSEADITQREITNQADSWNICNNRLTNVLSLAKLSVSILKNSQRSVLNWLSSNVDSSWVASVSAASSIPLHPSFSDQFRRRTSSNRESRIRKPHQTRFSTSYVFALVEKIIIFPMKITLNANTPINVHSSIDRRSKVILPVYVKEFYEPKAALISGSIESGFSFGPNRLMAWPSLFTKNFVKFHLMASTKKPPWAFLR